jgi:Do/DeqQ family serine protease
MPNAALKPLRAAALVAFALVLALPPAAAESPPKSRDEIKLSFAPVVKRVAPAVVNIRTSTGRGGLSDDPLYRGFGQESPGALGSGVILRPDGHLVTNHHVIRGATAVKVILADKREFAARVLVSDETTDLAIVKIEAPGATFPFLELRDADEVEVGDLVLAIGNPFGLGQTVTSGIVSAVARTVDGVTNYRSFIQTDASINPGNSGGALVTMDGRLIGINTFILSRGGGSVGIGFAVPSNMVGAVLRAAVEGGGKLQRPLLGVSVEDVTAQNAPQLGLKRVAGVIVRQVTPGSPAADAGVIPGDVILKIDGREVADGQNLRFRLATLSVGATITLTLVRGGREIDVKVHLKAPLSPSATVLEGRHPLDGAEVVQLTPAIAQQYNLRETAGVAVVRVLAGRPAQTYGFRPGDVIVQINGAEIDTVDKLRQVMQQGAFEWQVQIRRQGRVITAVLR